jgi:hypothetical protein
VRHPRFVLFLAIASTCACSPAGGDSDGSGAGGAAPHGGSAGVGGTGAGGAGSTTGMGRATIVRAHLPSTQSAWLPQIPRGTFRACSLRRADLRQMSHRFRDELARILVIDGRLHAAQPAQRRPPAVALVVFRDVTRRKLTEDRLRQAIGEVQRLKERLQRRITFSGSRSIVPHCLAS